MLVFGRHVPITRTARTEGPASFQRGSDGGIVFDTSSAQVAPTVRRDGERYDVRLGDASYLFERHEMQRLTIDAGARASELKVGRDVDVPVRVRGDDGKERIFNRGSTTAEGPKLGTIKIYGGAQGGWENIGVLSHRMIDPSPANAAIRGREQTQALGAKNWSESSRVGPNAWSLDTTAALLGGTLRC